MPIAPGADASRIRLAWRGDFCIDNAEGHKAELTDALASARELELDLGEVSRIDTAGLQLLAALVLELGQRGQIVHWQNLSRPVADAVRVTGLTSLFGLPAAAEP